MLYTRRRKECPMGKVYPPEQPGRLREIQAETLARPRRSYSTAARLLFVMMDVIYGKAASLRKYRVLEIVARVPYQAWENVAYVAITHTSETPTFARSIHDRVVQARAQQDNEQWHLLILEEMLHREGHRHTLLRDRILPQLIALTYYQISWLLYTISPKWSYRLNADFEDHAEHEYMSYVDDNPALDETPWESLFADDYGHHATVGDLFRQIGYDERLHGEESADLIEAARFGAYPA